MKLNAIVYLIFTLLFCACAMQKPIDFSTYKKTYLTFQSGGGFTGKFNTYVLLENGTIYKKDFDVISSKPVGKVKKNTAAQIFNNYEMLKLDEKELKQYDNFTYSIIKTTGTDAHEVSWGKGHDETKTLQIYFKSVVTQLAKQVKTQEKATLKSKQQ